jgi:hypothetical protein
MLIGWDYSFVYTIAAGELATDETDFPVVLRLGAAVGKTAFDATAIFTALGANKLKLACEYNGLGVQCPVEIELWDDVAEVAILHVKVPTVAAATDTVLRLYYDAAHADNTDYVGTVGSAAAQGVWESGFVAVYHMDQDPSGTAPQLLDSTTNARNLTTIGTMTSGDLVDSALGKGIDFDGSNDGAQYSNTGLSSVLTMPYTLEILSRHTDNLTNTSMIWFGDKDNTSLFASLNVRSADNKIQALQNGTYTMVSTNAVGVGADFYAGLAYHSSTLRHLCHNQTVTTSSTTTAAITGTDRISVGNFGDSTPSYGKGIIAEARFSNVTRSDAWMAGTYKSLTDALCTVTVGDNLIVAVLEQQWGTGEVRAELLQEWRLLLMANLNQPWAIMATLQAELTQSVGLRLLGTLPQPYGDAPIAQAGLWQWYGDCAEVLGTLAQQYGDALELRAALDQSWHVYTPLSALLEERYGITGTEVQGLLSQLWDLHGYDTVRAALTQPWMIAAAESLLVAAQATVTVAGLAVDPYHINCESAADQYPITGELHFAELGAWLGINEGDAVVITVAGQAINLIVESKRRSRRHGQGIYVVECASKAVLMDEPHALPLLARYDSILASTLAQQLATPYGITVDWRIVDDQVYDLYANNETPLALLRKMAGEWGGVLQCQPDGTLMVRKVYPASPPPAVGDTWNTVAAAATLTDQDNFFSADESLERRPGWNRYLIGNQDTATTGARLEEETVSATRKLLTASITPWADAALYSLATSRTGVQLQRLAVPAADYLVADELVEFVNGGGRTTKPCFALTSYAWQDTQLGAITFSEDGTLTAEVAGNSLLLLSYQTRFLRWQADYPNIADVQFILERQ